MPAGAGLSARPRMGRHRARPYARPALFEAAQPQQPDTHHDHIFLDKLDRLC